MSLVKQFWIAILLTVIITSAGSLVFNILSSKKYLEEQMNTKNIDNVTSLALSISQHKTDPISIDLLVSAQFDSGHYHQIKLTNPSGKIISQKINHNSVTNAPKWFINLVKIRTIPGISYIQNDWQQVGTLSLESDIYFAYNELWDITLKTIMWTLFIAFLACYIGGKILHRILDPLAVVVSQSKAIGEKRFITIKEPKTLEFKALVREMNKLSNSFKESVTKESSDLDELRNVNDFDKLTGLMSRDYFINLVSKDLTNQVHIDGALIILRFSNLAQLDKTMGYSITNALLVKISNVLHAKCQLNNSLVAGRLSGTDFAIYSKESVDEFILAQQIRAEVITATYLNNIESAAHFLVTCIKTQKEIKPEALFETLEFVLNISFLSKDSYLSVINANEVSVSEANYLTKWETLLNDALLNKRIKLEFYPVITPSNSLIHFESQVRLQLEMNGKWSSAGEFITWANQLKLANSIDDMALEIAIKSIADGVGPICVNVSEAAMCDVEYCKKALHLISESLSDPSLLSFEVSEAAVFDNLDTFKSFCSQMSQAGCRIGIEHLYLRIPLLGELREIGLTYIKIDASIIRSINSDATKKMLLSGLCTVIHSMGILAIAEGVSNEKEISALVDIGIDGLTGRGIKI